jgi:putative endonuclease
MKQPVVYILASQRNSTLHTGVTGDLRRRTRQHKTDLIEDFTKHYGIHRLVYFELCEDRRAAIAREKQIGRWNRVW